MASQVQRGAASSDWGGLRAPVSVVILTLNEEINIDACLDSCAWCDDVHVLDSGSVDRTRDIAQARGARVWVNPFESFGKQRNWAIDNIPVKHEWIFHLDADERFTPEIVREMQQRLLLAPGEAGYMAPSKFMFMDKWLKRSGGYPTFQMRLFHKGRMRFTDYGHGQREDTVGKVGRLDSPYLHYSFSKGLFDWFDKHNRYSSLEALQYLAQESDKPAMSELLANDPTQRRRAWKRVLYGIPGWPILHLIARLFVFGGILEGKAGITYCTMLAMYEQQIRLKLRVMRHARAKGTAFEADAAPKASTKRTDDVESPGLKHEKPATPPPPQEQAPAASDGTGGSAALIPEASPWTTREKILRALWMLAGKPAFGLTFHNWYGVRRMILRFFGARVGKRVRVRPSADIEIPWNVEFKEGCVVGDHAIIYSLGRITIGRNAVISQYAHVCAGTHDHTDRRFPLIRDPIVIGDGAWISTDAFVGPNVTVGDMAILGARASAYRDLEAGTIYAGNPAKPIRKREMVAS